MNPLPIRYLPRDILIQKKIPENHPHGAQAAGLGKVILSNYIIRIYRRDKNDPRLIVGIVEKVGTKEKKGFTNFDELREILVPAAGRASRRKTGTYRKLPEENRG